MNTNKKEYTAPKLTVVSFKVEKGFVGSNNPIDALLLQESNNTRQMESYGTTSWHESGGFWGSN